MDFILNLAGAPFDLDYTLESGQVFRWRNEGEWWVGVVSGAVLKVKQEGDSLYCSSSSDLLDGGFVRSYFRLDENLEFMVSSFSRDAQMTRAVQQFYGLRLVRQDRWECLASFVLATNRNIPSIKQMVSKVCSKFGSPLKFEGSSYSTFPSPEVLADSSVDSLEGCGLGYRAGFLKKVAQAVDQGVVDFSELTMLDYEGARDLLLGELFGEKLLLGVGPKVADCVLLFSLGKDEAFPIDVWIARALGRYYPGLLSERARTRLSSKGKVVISGGEYRRISAAVRGYFGKYAGYAQQYLFMLARAEAPSASSS